jgi:hypothetical protein
MVNQRSQTSSHITQKTALEEERMREIHLLLQHLFKHEETTLRLILDDLYDVGSKNLIKQKIRCRPIRGLVEPIAKMSKPVFRIFAVRWFHKNCPQLITQWLRSQVAFEEPFQETTVTQDITVSTPEVRAISAGHTSEEIAITPHEQPELATQIHHYQHEIRRLHTQVRWLTGTLVSAIALLGGSLLWVSYNPESMASRTALPLQPIAIEDTNPKRIQP